MVAYVFPGQGSQKTGMGLDLKELSVLASEMYDEADAALGFPISSVSFEGPEEELTKTRNAQLAILIYNAIATRLLVERTGKKPEVVAGHSLGEFSALLAAEMVSFSDALKIVNKRGELMASADPDSRGAMAAVLGLDDETVKRVCAEISIEHYVEPVNFNCPGQVVISGLKPAIDIAETRLKEAGAKRVLKLAVSVAFHSKLMENASLEFGEFLKTISFKPPICPVISNVTADTMDASNVRELLTLQMRSPVQWTKSIQTFEKMGVKECVEIGYGSVLAGMIKKISPIIAVKTWKDA